MYDIVEVDGVPQKGNKLPVLTDFKPSDISNWFQIPLGGDGANMNSDGSSTPVSYARYDLSGYDQYITSMILLARATDAKLDQFMSLGSLSNGLLFRMKSEDIVTNPFLTIQNNWQILNYFSNPNDYFYSYKESSNKYYLTAVHVFDTPVIIKAQSTYEYSDYILIEVQDDLTTLTELQCIVRGYKEAV